MTWMDVVGWVAAFAFCIGLDLYRKNSCFGTLTFFSGGLWFALLSWLTNS